ncbi:MAG: O-methyltransferase [Deltaproteobacteria bacterium]|nr:O-methyltransferase [Deltaproteobacteria bacterium]MBI3389304.1 O-methyltransferase [Deltaproteobacteria bacterium]
MTPDLYAYLVAHGTARDAILDDLSRETSALGPISMMEIAPEQGAFMTLLARAIGARSAIEVGTFTGYSGVCIARGLAPGGKLLCCDISEEWTTIARRYFQRAGLTDRIELRIAPALETLRALPLGETVDFAFIDADKSGYRVYYEEILKRLRPNGLILFDNVLWQGQVIDQTNASDDTKAIRDLNEFLARDARVQAVMLSVSDGLTIVRKRAAGE